MTAELTVLGVDGSTGRGTQGRGYQVRVPIMSTLYAVLKPHAGSV